MKYKEPKIEVIEICLPDILTASDGGTVKKETGDVDWVGDPTSL